MIVQQRKLDEQLTTEKNVTKTQLSKKAKNCPTPIVMATPTQQTKVQSKAMYDEEFQQMGAGMMVTGQYKVSLTQPMIPRGDCWKGADTEGCMKQELIMLQGRRVSLWRKTPLENY